MILRCAFVFLFSVLCINFTQAHTRSQSFSKWIAKNNLVDFSFTVDARRITQLASIYSQTTFHELLDQHLKDNLQVFQKDKLCTLQELNVPVAYGSFFRAGGRFLCPDNIDEYTRVRITAFLEVSSSHIHFARTGETDSVKEHVLTSGKSEFFIFNTAASESIYSFIKLGFRHVISGLDHLLFLLALLLVATRAATALWCITGFTIGHSLTLIVATLQLIKPDESLIEAFIGFTIAITALEASRVQTKTAFSPAICSALVFGIACVTYEPAYIFFGFLLATFAFFIQKYRPATDVKFLIIFSIAFGLVHGAGFSGGLQELNIPQKNLLVALLGFNIGVELAQLLAASFIFILIRGAQRVYFVNTEQLYLFVSAVLFGFGIYWFSIRLWRDSLPALF